MSSEYDLLASVLSNSRSSINKDFATKLEPITTTSTRKKKKRKVKKKRRDYNAKDIQTAEGDKNSDGIHSNLQSMHEMVESHDDVIKEDVIKDRRYEDLFKAHEKTPDNQLQTDEGTSHHEGASLISDDTNANSEENNFRNSEKKSRALRKEKRNKAKELLLPEKLPNMIESADPTTDDITSRDDSHMDIFTERSEERAATKESIRGVSHDNEVDSVTDVDTKSNELLIQPQHSTSPTNIKISQSLKFPFHFFKKKTLQNDVLQISESEKREKLPLFETNDSKYDSDESVLQIHIVKADILKTSSIIIHPVVRITIIDLETGKLMKKDDSIQNSVYSNEQGSKCEYILPIMTKPYDMKIRSLTPEWGESIIFNEKYKRFVKPEIIFVFEILEFSVTGNSIDDSSGMYKIAWGYLKPVKINGRSNTEKMIRVQLYKYPTTIMEKIERAFSACIPISRRSNVSYFANSEAFNLFKIRDRKPFPSTLYVKLEAVKRPEAEVVKFPERPILPTQIEKSRIDYGEFLKEISKKKLKNQKDGTIPMESVEKISKDSDKEEINRMEILEKERFLKYGRRVQEPCIIPMKLLYEIYSGERGSVSVCFSNSGRFLACACTGMNSSFIKLIDLWSGKMVSKLQAHMNIIYCLRWSSDDSEIVSCSSDGTAKTWDVSRISPKKIYEKELNVQVQLLHVLQHRCFVYSATYYTHYEKHKLVFTASYDRLIRMWNSSTGQLLQELDGHSCRVNSITMEPCGGRLFSADASGRIKMWEIKNELEGEDVRLELSTTVDLPELKISSIFSIKCHPKYPKERLLVHSQDNVIRIVDCANDMFSGVKQRFSGVKCHLNGQHSAFSPDGKYVVTGSENGRLFYWECDSSDVINKEGLDYGYCKDSPITDIQWSPNEHIIAMCSFGTNHQPIRIFGHEKSTQEVDTMTARKKSIENEREDGNVTESMEHEKEK